MIVQCANPACRKFNLVEANSASACLLCRAPLPAPPGPAGADDDALFPPVVADDAALGLD